MANKRTTIPLGGGQISPTPVRSSARYWVKITGAWDSSTAQNGIPCDGVQVDSAGAQLTGIPGGQPVGTTPVQNAPYAANVRYPDSYYTITAISTGNVWLYWLEDPTGP